MEQDGPALKRRSHSLVGSSAQTPAPSLRATPAAQPPVLEDLASLVPLFKLLSETYDVPANKIFSEFHAAVSAAAQSVAQGELVEGAQSRAQVLTALLGEKDAVGYVLPAGPPSAALRAVFHSSPASSHPGVPSPAPTSFDVPPIPDSPALATRLEFPGRLDWEQQELATELSELSKVILHEFFEAGDEATFRQCLGQLIRAGLDLRNAVARTTDFFRFKERIGSSRTGTHNAKNDHSPRALLLQISKAIHHFSSPGHMAFVFGGMASCAISGDILSKMTPAMGAAGIETKYFEVRWVVENIPGWEAFEGAMLVLSGFWHWHRSSKKLYGFNFHGAHNTAPFFGGPTEEKALSWLAQNVAFHDQIILANGTFRAGEPEHLRRDMASVILNEAMKTSVRTKLAAGESVEAPHWHLKTYQRKKGMNSACNDVSKLRGKFGPDPLLARTSATSSQSDTERAEATGKAFLELYDRSRSVEQDSDFSVPGQPFALRGCDLDFLSQGYLLEQHRSGAAKAKLDTSARYVEAVDATTSAGKDAVAFSQSEEGRAIKAGPSRVPQLPPRSAAEAQRRQRDSFNAAQQAASVPSSSVPSSAAPSSAAPSSAAPSSAVPSSAVPTWAIFSRVGRPS